MDTAFSFLESASAYVPSLAAFLLEPVGTAVMMLRGFVARPSFFSPSICRLSLHNSLNAPLRGRVSRGWV
jgi:hypothetical protein